MIARETILTALFTLISSSASFVTASRRIKLWGDVPGGDRPALFMVDHGDEYQRNGSNLPPIVTMNAEFFIYIDAGKDQSAVPSTTLNNLLDAIDLALKPDIVTGAQTLGGLVRNCWIEGKVMKDPGDLDGDGMAVIPIKILATV